MGASSSSDKSLASSRDVSRRVLDALGVSGSNKNGTVYVGEYFSEFTEDKTTKVRVNKVTWYKKALSRKNRLPHEFLVLELAPFGKFERTTYMQAEKIYVYRKKLEEGEVQDPQPGGRIEVRSIDSAKLSNELEKKYEVDMGGSGEILVQQLLKVLVTHSGRYSLWKNNCWLYAYDTFDRLLRQFAELPDTSYECKERLEREKLPTPDLPSDLLSQVLELVVRSACTATGCAIRGSLFIQLVTGLPVGVKCLAGSSLVREDRRTLIKIARRIFGTRLGRWWLAIATVSLKRKLLAILLGSVVIFVILLSFELCIMYKKNKMKPKEVNCKSAG